MLFYCLHLTADEQVTLEKASLENTSNCFKTVHLNMARFWLEGALEILSVLPQSQANLRQILYFYIFCVQICFFFHLTQPLKPDLHQAV